MVKKHLLIACASVLLASTALSLASCGSSEFDGILIWGPKEHEQLYLDAIAAYKADHPDFDVEVRFAAQGDAGANDNVGKDVESAGSIITFPNDQLISLKRYGALSKLTDSDVAWAKANNVEASVEAGKIGDGYYAYPISADNGFVFIYNRDAFKDTSVWDSTKNTLKEGYTFRDLYKALDERGAQTDHEAWAGGKVIWPAGSAWYESGVFFATGGDYSVEYDEKGVQISAKCDFGYKLEGGVENYDNGLDALRCMMNSMTNEDGTVSPHFTYTDDSDPAYNDYVSDHIGKGSKAATEPLAGVVSWNNSAPREAWGDNYDVAILPKLVADCKLLGGSSDKVYTWRSFSGFKLMGVNPFCAFARKDPNNVEILHELAQYLSGKDVSLKRYEATNLGPSNLEAQEDEAVKNDKFLKALNQQYSLTDASGKNIGFRVQDSTPANFWTPIANVGKAVFEALGGKTGSYNNVNNAKRCLKQLQADIEKSAD